MPVGNGCVRVEAMPKKISRSARLVAAVEGRRVAIARYYEALRTGTMPADAIAVARAADAELTAAINAMSN